MALQCSAGIAFPPLAIFDTKDAGTSMALATLIARPRSAPTHDLKFMSNYLSEGYDLSITEGKYLLLADGYVIPNMQTVFETRRQRLALLVKEHGTVAKLNRAMGWEDTNARLYQIHNRSVRADRGTLYEMGDPTARQIEKKLGLDEGWMDTPPPKDAGEQAFGVEPLPNNHAVAETGAPSWPAPVLAASATSPANAVSALRAMLLQHGPERRKTCADVLTRFALNPDNEELAAELAQQLAPPPPQANQKQAA